VICLRRGTLVVVLPHILYEYASAKLVYDFRRMAAPILPRA
jgi:hypothetical protein